MQYQTFPDVTGGSNSLQKLKALRLPSLAGKRFLDVGCNEGYFAGYALFEGASRVVGIDYSKTAIERAQARFPDAEFYQQSWDTLPEGPFDVILLASALHYADDQAALLKRLMSALSESGTLVLELGIAQSGDNTWISVTRSIDERLFPTRRKLNELLADYAWKVIGHSAPQTGDPVPRYVVHIRPLKPYVFLLLETPATGKSTLGRVLFSRAEIPVISGDRIYMQIARGQIAAPAALTAVVSHEFSTASIDRVTTQVFQHGLLDDLVDIWCAQAGYRDFALDSYVPADYRQQVSNLLLDKGYIPVSLNWEMNKSMATPAEAEERAQAYTESLASQHGERRLGTIDVRKTPSTAGHSLIYKWHLDQPAKGELRPNGTHFTVSGWVLPNTAVRPAAVYARSGLERLRFAIDRRRRDVVQAFPEAAARSSEQCGFSFVLDAAWLDAGVEVGFVVEDKLLPVVTLTVPESRPEVSIVQRIMADLRRRFRQRFA
ncbi:hypothetical protein CAI21_13940 [Alkalilimnicola ehrlichii]|uniref:Methyltransferase domain-containing protein n=1 Tax=Alkalilimnicola ehrlichii TaxID=351052 RepID=A0A3E0WR42_9GAMM|nr:class I SAM-dependent methyltransferase [Alkalilimnicola ehrlichii]RFA28012.1 hypothetical protein CAI21_13940 [Alkalilimnicola ehrlichii]RFA34663.1 hypothetical protein CAL65_14980 [Alkalilimnicola ehrlichii]